MKFTLETSDVNLISAWEPDAVRVGKAWYRGHLILSSQHILSDWTVTAPDILQANDLSAAIELGRRSFSWAPEAIWHCRTSI